MNEILLKMKQWQKAAFSVGIFCLLLTGTGMVLDPRTAFVSYLFSYLFWFALVLGCFLMAMIHYLIGGDWGNVTRRIFEAGFLTLPMVGALLIPVFFGLPQLYPWAKPDLVAASHMLQQKTGYDNGTAFRLRAAAFFAISIFLSRRLRHWSIKQDTTADAGPSVKLRIISGPSVATIPFLATFVLIDWAMSIEPAWYSTIFPIILMAGGVLAAIALAVLFLAICHTHLPYRGIITQKHFLDLGNLLLAFVMFWTYVTFSQWLIIYSSNQPHEIGWYLSRINRGWKWLIVLVIVFHFMVPFFILLFRSAKKNVRLMAALSAMILTFNVLATYWTIVPTFYPAGLQVHWTDFTAWAGIGGIWVGVFLCQLAKSPLIINPRPKETQMEVAS